MRSTILFLCALILLMSAPVRAANVLNVRLGQYADYDRIVFDLDEETTYQVQPLVEDSLQMSLSAETGAREINSAKGLVRSLVMTPGEQGSEVAIRLVSSGLQVKYMMLNGPPRIVVDVRKPKPVIAQTPLSYKPPEAEVEAVVEDSEPALPLVDSQEQADEQVMEGMTMPVPAPGARSPGLDLVRAGIPILLAGVFGFIWHRRRSTSGGFEDEEAGKTAMVPRSQYQELAERFRELESELSEINTACARLEQLSTKQSEELRVQRAAIAHTQGILRGLKRSEEV